MQPWIMGVYVLFLVILILVMQDLDVVILTLTMVFFLWLFVFLAGIYQKMLNLTRFVLSLIILKSFSSRQDMLTI
ncbi:hypothetical protein BJP23_06260 [Aeromonas veronii bv. veronii]|nr:hypothetical protein BJP23_06260 [Aeromonas veronii bv. veronii]